MCGGAEAGSPTVVFLPPAGGAASVFRPLIGHLPDSWRIVAVDPPGHGFNRGTLLDRVEDMVDAYDQALEPMLTGAYHLVGQSLGGLLAYLLASRLEQRRHPPTTVTICASRSPKHVVAERWSTLSDDAFIDKLDGIGGVPDAFRDDRESLKAWLPPIRADFLALERWDGERELPRISAPLSVIAGDRDDFAFPNIVRDWTGYGHQSQFLLFNGGHFFIQSDPARFCAWLVQNVG